MCSGSANPLCKEGKPAVNDYGIYINIATLIAIVGGIVKITLHVSDGQAKLDKAIDQSEAELKQDMTDLERRLTAMVENKERESFARADVLRQADEALMRHAGELGNALRTKIHEFETWSRDEFVRKGSFEMVVGRLEKSIERIGEKIDDMPKTVVELAKQI